MSQHFSAILDNLRLVTAKRKSVKESVMQHENVPVSILPKESSGCESSSTNSAFKSIGGNPLEEWTPTAAIKPNNNNTRITIEVDRARSPVAHQKIIPEQANAINDLALAAPAVPVKSSGQRRMSVSGYRSRAGSFIPVDEEGRSILLRKPIRLKNIEGRAEVYDTLHLKGGEVSVKFIFFFFVLDEK